MSDFAILFLILGVVYISDCVVKARKGTIGLVTFFGGRFRITRPEDVPITAGSGLLFANPIPGAGTILVCESWPISVSPTGVFSYVARAIPPSLRPPQVERFVAFDSVRTV